MLILKWAAILIGCGAIAVLMIYLGFIFASLRMKRQKHEALAHIKQHPNLESAAQALVDNNIFVYFNNVGNPEIPELVLTAVSEAWTRLSAEPEFYEQPLNIGYGFNQTNVTAEFHERLHNLGMRNAADQY